MSGQERRLIVTAGGINGHMFPGLAVTHHLMDQGWQVRWLGTVDRMEADLMPKNGIEIDFIRISGLRDKGMKAQLLAPVRVPNTWRQARAIMKRFQSGMILGTDDYVSGPGGLVTRSLGIPVVLHEQNDIAGLTNKWLAKIVRKMIQAFPDAFPHANVAGNPMHADALTLLLPGQRLAGYHGPTRVPMVDGSQGAHVLNQAMPQVATGLDDTVAIWHRNDKGDQQTVQQAYVAVGQPQYKMTEFIDDMAAAYAWTDVMVCHSGALMVSEIMTADLLALFAPFQRKGRQRYWNALPLEKTGVVKILEQPEFTVEAVAFILASWGRETLLDMTKRTHGASIPDVAERIAEGVSAIALAC